MLFTHRSRGNLLILIFREISWIKFTPPIILFKLKLKASKSTVTSLHIVEGEKNTGLEGGIQGKTGDK